MRRLRPFARRRESTRRPSAVFMRRRNPCFARRLRRCGWNVRFMSSSSPRTKAPPGRASRKRTGSSGCSSGGAERARNLSPSRRTCKRGTGSATALQACRGRVSIRARRAAGTVSSISGVRLVTPRQVAARGSSADAITAREGDLRGRPPRAGALVVWRSLCIGHARPARFVWMTCGEFTASPRGRFHLTTFSRAGYNTAPLTSRSSSSPRAALRLTSAGPACRPLSSRRPRSGR